MELDQRPLFHRPNRDLTIDYEPCGYCIVKANELLRDVFVNLVGNAIKHSGGMKMLVDDYHGKSWVEDRVQGDHKQGAKFVVMLPAVN